MEMWWKQALVVYQPIVNLTVLESGCIKLGTGKQARTKSFYFVEDDGKKV